MPVRYITVTPETNLFKPATRSFGDIAIIGAALAQDVKLTATDVTTITTGVNSVAQLKQKLKSTYPRSEDVDAFFTTNSIQTVAGFATPGTNFIADRKAGGPVKTPIPITNPDSVSYKTLLANEKAVDSPDWFNGDLGRAVRKAFSQTPGPTVVWAICTASSQGTAALTDALTEVAKLDVQLVVLANTPLKSAATSLAADIDATTPTIQVASTANFPASLPFRIQVETEVILVTAKTGTTWTVTRGAQATTAATHARGVAVTYVEGKTEIEALADHVKTVSNTGGDGKERIGIAMLGKGITDASVITTNMASPRMVMVAHKSDEDAAAAVAGTIAGYQPHISLLLKAVSLGMEDLFSDSEIDGFNTNRVNWLTDPTLLPGKGLFMGEGYTLGADIPYIDIIRTIDDISFRLKAALIRTIGNLRVSRSGLRSLVSQMVAVLEPLKQQEVIEGYDIFLPLQVLLDKPPATLIDSELQQIQNAQNARVVDAIISVDYAGAIHRLNIKLKFE